MDLRDFSLSISLKLALSNSWLSIFNWSILVASALLIRSPSPSVSSKVISWPSYDSNAFATILNSFRRSLICSDNAIIFCSWTNISDRFFATSVCNCSLSNFSLLKFNSVFSSSFSVSKRVESASSLSLVSITSILDNSFIWVFKSSSALSRPDIASLR